MNQQGDQATRPRGRPVVTSPLETGAVTPEQARGARLPDFLIIGAMKAGTTTLHQTLQRHPNIFMSETKEVFFYSHTELYEKGDDWYRAFFYGAGDDQLCGEATPSYTMHPYFDHTPGRIAKARPDMKLIYIVRHPVERTWSHFSAASIGGAEEVERGIMDPGFLNPTRYTMQIRRYLEHFDRDQIHWLVLEDLKNDPARCHAELQRFLGVPVVDLTGEKPVAANPRDTYFRNRQSRSALARLRRIPGVGWLGSHAPEGLKRPARRAIQWVARDSPIGRLIARRRTDAQPTLTPQVRAELITEFESDIAEFEQFTGRSFPEWRR